MSRELEAQIEALKAENEEFRKRLEAVEQASSVLRPAPPEPRPNGALSWKVRNAYAQNKKRYQAQLRATLCTGDSYIAIRSAGRNLWYDPSDQSHIPTRTVTTVQLPRAVAALLTGEAEVRYRLENARRIQEQLAPNDTRADNSNLIKRLEVELKELVLCTNDLINDTPLELHQKFTQPQKPRH